MLFAELVEASAAVAATRSRKEKTALLAGALERLDSAEVAAAIGFLVGAPRQGRIGVGWATVSAVEVTPPDQPSLTVGEIDAAITELAATTGPGSATRRAEQLGALFRRATASEADFLRRLFVGELRQGALDGVLADAVARAAGVPAGLVRRAAMLSGDLGATAELGLAEGRAALERVGLSVGRAIQPMLASTAEDLPTALADLGQASVEWKLDGIRVQVHRNGGDVRVFTRNLNDVTERVPEIVRAVLGYDVESVVLDGEAIMLGADERPVAFQDTMSDFGTDDRDGAARPLRSFFFDVLHLDGDDLIDRPLVDRRQTLVAVVGSDRVPAIDTGDSDEAELFNRSALDAGHEGVMVKALDSRYEAGRRGKVWRKVKPVHTLDLVVLAVEWGHGRRQGWLSNLHLGAVEPSGGYVMVGKTFKGLTDQLLEWQTARFLELEERRSGHTVWVRPEQVVEVAIDGVQSSTRYPGGAALRFARVRRYRDDKSAADADTIERVRSFL